MMGYEKELCNKQWFGLGDAAKEGAFRGLVNVDSAQLGWLSWCSSIPNIQSLFSWYQWASLPGLLKVMASTGTLGETHKASWGSGSGWGQYGVVCGKNKSQVKTPNQESLEKDILPKLNVHCTVRWKEGWRCKEVNQQQPPHPKLQRANKTFNHKFEVNKQISNK